NYPFLPEKAAGGAIAGTNVTPLTASQLQQTATAALDRLSLAGVAPDIVRQLSTVTFTLGNLSGGELGLADVASHTGIIDSTAAGYGWFVDATPLRDEEFDANGIAVAGGPAVGRMDLLTVVLHELGHIYGWGDLDPATAGNQLMNGMLGTGTRRTQDLAV